MTRGQRHVNAPAPGPSAPGDAYERFFPPPTHRVPIRSDHLVVDGTRVHLEHVGTPDAPVRLLLLHGAGGHSGALRPVARRLAALGALVTSPDLPGYGMTQVPRPGRVRYDDWRTVARETLRSMADERPVVVLGASMGGMLGYDTVAAVGADALVVTCLLDPRLPQVRARLGPVPALAPAVGPALRLFAGPLADLRVPVRWLSDMRAIANDQGLVAAVVRDRRGGGTRVPLGWVRSYLESTPVVEPEHFQVPTLLLHPALDRWTPPELSLAFLDRIAAPHRATLLEGCGHFPIERPGLEQMLAEVRGVLDGVADAGSR